MPRVELWMTIFAGLAGGLAGVLWGGLVTGPWLARRGGLDADPSRTETAARVLGAAALRAVAGGVLGFLFWLGWGLIALVGQPWYAIGLLYGGLCWSAIAAPVLGTLLLRGHATAPALAAHALEWLVSCAAIGLLCALAWHRYA
jgi:hypothetical protein